MTPSSLQPNPRRPSRKRALRGVLPLLAAGAMALIAAPAFALKSDRDKPMDVTSNDLQTSMNEGISTLTGNVKITQGSLLVTSDKAVVHQGKDQAINRAVLNGAPARLQQDLDEGGKLDARAAQIDYDMATDIVVLTGSVVVIQPRGELRGERVTYDLNTGKLNSDGQGGDGRVHLHMNPTPKAPKAAKPEAAKTEAAKPAAAAPKTD
jgi:lipopolysaccharide export system protein LptA